MATPVTMRSSPELMAELRLRRRVNSRWMFIQGALEVGGECGPAVRLFPRAGAGRFDIAAMDAQRDETGLVLEQDGAAGT